MRATLSIAALAAFIAGSTAVVLPERASCDSKHQIQCTGEVIVGSLQVRNPDNSLHVAGFSTDTVIDPAPFLTTKYNGVPTPSSRQFAFQVCNNILNPADSTLKTKTGFLLPNGHRDKAVTVRNATTTVGHPAQALVSLPKQDSCFTDATEQQWWRLYPNGSLAFTAATPTGGYGVITNGNSDKSNIFVSVEYTDAHGFSLQGLTRPFGYSLELHA
ncbi:hypothetical protein OC846_004944 [Tilletia horrida]|uniref:Ricin B lectin domain-containing protein n=1 Tax=Tilletia horrida TaxID=155126 RepID=A0AAN6JWG9_9BASI|nr:hypothetical protein OC846_004944 [Tilletia horrida]KAK0564613.1 hypothetical protein OC861_004203 [Tilletia horrida]